MTRVDTRERILDTAERLFAEKGISGTSLRALTKAAAANLASVHYHFGSKEALLDAVVERRAKPLNAERLRLLAAFEDREAKDEAPEVEAILQAFTVPALTALPMGSEEGQRLARLLARIEGQPPKVVEQLSRKHFGHVARQFVEALQRALPHLPGALVAARFRFAVGLFSYLFSGNLDLDFIPDHPPHSGSPEERVADAIGFMAAGLRAPECDAVHALVGAGPRPQGVTS